MKADVERVRAKRQDVIWIDEMVSKNVVYQLYSHAGVFCCPSIYEPFGIINLEAMACETPVVGSAVGGIKEVIVDGETGFLVPLEQHTESPFEALNPDKFARALAEKINVLMRDPELRKRFGQAGRKRAVEKFSWHAIALATKKMYAELITR
jgi:glycosyltransferase involved in cell wall biosynthesis